MTTSRIRQLEERVRTERDPDAAAELYELVEPIGDAPLARLCVDVLRARRPSGAAHRKIVLPDELATEAPIALGFDASSRYVVAFQSVADGEGLHVDVASGSMDTLSAPGFAVAAVAPHPWQRRAIAVAHPGRSGLEWAIVDLSTLALRRQAPLSDVIRLTLGPDGTLRALARGSAQARAKSWTYEVLVAHELGAAFQSQARGAAIEDADEENLHLSPGGDWIHEVRGMDVIRLWSTTRSTCAELRCPGEILFCRVLADDARALTISGSEAQYLVRCWTLADLRILEEACFEPRPVSDLSFVDAGGGDQIVGYAADAAWLWEPGALAFPRRAHSDSDAFRGYSATCDKTGRRLVQSDGRQLELVDFARHAASGPLPDQLMPIAAHAPAPRAGCLTVAAAGAVVLLRPSGAGRRNVSTLTVESAGEGRDIVALGCAADAARIAWIERRERGDVLVRSELDQPLGEASDVSECGFRLLPELAQGAHARGLSVHPTGEIMALATEHGDVEVELLRWSDGACLGRFEVDAELYQLAFSPDGTRLCVCTRAGDVEVWELGSRTRIAHTLDQWDPSHAVGAIGFDDAGVLLGTRGERVLRVTEDGVEVVLAPETERDIGTVAFDVSGRWLARSIGDGRVEIVDLEGDASPVTAILDASDRLSFMADGRLIGIDEETHRVATLAGACPGTELSELDAPDLEPIADDVWWGRFETPLPAGMDLAPTEAARFRALNRRLSALELDAVERERLRSDVLPTAARLLAALEQLEEEMVRVNLLVTMPSSRRLPGQNEDFAAPDRRKVRAAVPSARTGAQAARSVLAQTLEDEALARDVLTLAVRLVDAEERPDAEPPPTLSELEDMLDLLLQQAELESTLHRRAESAAALTSADVADELRRASGREECVAPILLACLSDAPGASDPLIALVDDTSVDLSVRAGAAMSLVAFGHARPGPQANVGAPSSDAAAEAIRGLPDDVQGEIERLWARVYMRGALASWFPA